MCNNARVISENREYLGRGQMVKGIVTVGVSKYNYKWGSAKSLIQCKNKLFGKVGLL